jgi:hypothetical protein
VYIIFTLSHPTASIAYSAKSICIWPNMSVSAFIPIHKHGQKWPLRRLKVKSILPQLSLPNVTYVVPVAVNYSYCTPNDGYGKYPKQVEGSCNKINIVLHLVGHFMCIFIMNL